MKELKTIDAFLLELDAEVGGHAAMPLTEEDLEGLRQLAKGRADDGLKARLEVLLSENAEAMRRFAELLRGDGEAQGES